MTRLFEKKLLPAHMNHGRWLIMCSTCSAPLLAQENGAVCPIEYPGITAKYHLPLPPPYPVGATKTMADNFEIDKARAQADAAGELYFADYPADKAAIEAVLRERKLENMNWLPGEDLAYLRRDNSRHSVPLPPERNG